MEEPVGSLLAEILAIEVPSFEVGTVVVVGHRIQRLIFNPACGQLNRKKMNFPCPVRALEFGLARRFSCPIPRQPAHSPRPG